MFNYAFMQRALWVGFLIALITPLIGQSLVLKRMSMVSDAIAHTTLAGVAIGLILGIDPLISALITSLMGVMVMDALRRKLPQYAEVSVAILMAVGIGLAGTLSSFVADSNRFSAFLFGSIVATNTQEVVLISVIAVGVLVTYLLFYKEIFAITFDENMAEYEGIPVKWVNILIMFMMSLTLSMAAKTVGSLILSSLMILPVASALQLQLSYQKTLLSAIAFSLISMMGGLVLSFYLGIKPGGAVVLLSVLIYVLILPLKRRHH